MSKLATAVKNYLNGTSDRNPGIGFSIPGSEIEKFVNQGYRFGIRLTDWSLFWYPQLTYFMHRAPMKGISELWRMTVTVKIQIFGDSTKQYSSAHKIFYSPEGYFFLFLAFNARKSTILANFFKSRYPGIQMLPIPGFGIGENCRDPGIAISGQQIQRSTPNGRDIQNCQIHINH